MENNHKKRTVKPASKKTVQIHKYEKILALIKLIVNSTEFKSIIIALFVCAIGYELGGIIGKLAAILIWG